MGVPAADRLTSQNGKSNRGTTSPETSSDATADPLGGVGDALRDIPPLWGVVGASAIPDALADALASQVELGKALVTGPVERQYPLAKRLLAAYEFLRDAQENSKRDPSDGALLVTDPLRYEIKGPARIVTISTGEEIPVVTQGSETAQPAMPVWAPKRFPEETDPNKYPRRPRDLS